MSMSADFQFIHSNRTTNLPRSLILHTNKLVLENNVRDRELVINRTVSHECDRYYSCIAMIKYTF